MRIGISLRSNWPADPQQGMHDMVLQAREAYRAGLASLLVGDGHVTEQCYLQNTPVLARLSAEWIGRRPAGCLFLLPLWNPVLVAEHVATLSTMFDGPLILPVAAGSGSARFAAMGVDIDARAALVEQSMHVITSLFDGETVTNSLLGIAGAQLAFSPLRGVRWWVAGTSRAALRRAARWRAAWYAPPQLPAEKIAALAACYREECARTGTSPCVVVRRDAVIAADAHVARRHASAMLAAGYPGYGSFDPAAAIAGDADGAAAAFHHLAELGVAEVIIRCLTDRQPIALETIQAVGTLLSGPEFRTACTR